ncbi:hypothetical protein [Candidatus Thioglobus sp.]|uniref:hypothetical protein n=1 Tax=Candidatus Thioglobus sp. TaxID=2026721 RepID=UPI003D0D2D49
MGLLNIENIIYTPQGSAKKSQPIKQRVFHIKICTRQASIKKNQIIGYSSRFYMKNTLVSKLTKPHFLYSTAP